jgi:hypothetical protein
MFFAELGYNGYTQLETQVLPDKYKLFLQEMQAVVEVHYLQGYKHA